MSSIIVGEIGESELISIQSDLFLIGEVRNPIKMSMLIIYIIIVSTTVISDRRTTNALRTICYARDPFHAL